jgi:hypothetical protein
MKRIIKILLAIILITKSISYCYGQELNKQQIQTLVDNMLISKNYHVNMKKIPPAVNGIRVVVVGLPYREFPSIIILNRDTQMHRWERVFECLSPGIQNTPSGILDFHTKGIAADFTLDK